MRRIGVVLLALGLLGLPLSGFTGYAQAAATSTADDRYVVISNESPDVTSQASGSFSLNSLQSISLNKKLKSGPYKVDVNLPFDPAANKENLIQKSTNYLASTNTVGDVKSFWVTNIVKNVNYQINATLTYSGTKANVWVYNNQITAANAKTLGQEFDNRIYSSVTNNFGRESDVNSDGKINILCYDIQDGFSGNGAYIGGYFYEGDLYNTTYSNKSEIFYIDTYPAMGTGTIKDPSEVYGTLAHEFQHMVNYNQNVLIEKKSSMDTWLNEGLSMAAEQVYLGHGLQERVDYYNMSDSIRNGHSLLYWDQSGDLLSNYSLAYLFIQYVKIQAGQGDKIFKEMLLDSDNSYKAVEDVAKKYISPDMTFGKLMTDFRVALLLKQPTGLYGFKGDSFFNQIQTQMYTGSSVSLRGGGAVVISYNSADGFTEPTTKGPNITYTYLEQGGGSDASPPATPITDEITDHETVLTGTAEPGATVIAKVSGKEIGRGTAGATGNFSVTVPVQAAGSVVNVYAVDAAQNVSVAGTVTVSSKLQALVGETRYSTAVKVSQAGWKTANTVMLVNGGAIVDGLTATPLASAKDAPMLLTKNGSVPAETMNELKRLQARNVILIGGTGVIYPQVADALIAEGYSVSRIGGKDRYETSLMIAKELDKIIDVNTAFVAYGRGEPDALSIAAEAGKEMQPIILTDKNAVPAATFSWLQGEGLRTAYFIGGTGVIAPSVMSNVDTITSLDVSGNRISGADRHETNAKVISKFYPGSELPSILVSKSATLSLVDALTAGPLAAKMGAPVLLVSAAGLQDSQRQMLSGKHSKYVHQIGGGVNTSAINEVVGLK